MRKKRKAKNVNGHSTIEFYRLFQEGKLGDEEDLMMWAGLYHLYRTKTQG